MEIPENLNIRSNNEPQNLLPQNVLIGILDWGLGHATRCIPIIQYMHQFQCRIFIATSAAQRALLSKEFPDLIFLDAPRYKISYSNVGKWFLAKIILQIPRLLRVIRAEKRWLSNIIEKHHINLVVSDNRYGLYDHRVKSIFICHQLSPTAGFWSFSDNIIRRVHYRFIGHFDNCWIPDAATAPGLAGKLAHPSKLPGHVEYIGPLSRMKIDPSVKDDLLLVLLSGPEPQRTALEKIMLSQLASYPGRHLLVRGLPGEETSSLPFTVNHLDGEKLNRVMNQAGMVICRAGYSSIMDLVKLKKKAILIPTPGQTEQEYLAFEMERRGIFLHQRQQDFLLDGALRKASHFPFDIPDMDFNGFEAPVYRSLSIKQPNRNPGEP